MSCNSLPTPQTILEDDEIDVFESMIDDSEYLYQKKRTALWSAYRFRSIGCGNIAYWIQTMQDRYNTIKTEYDIKFQAVEEWLNTISEKIDLSDYSEESSHTTNYGRILTTSLGQRQRTDVIAEKKQTTENEDTPDNVTSGTKYLSNRSTTTENPHTDTYTEAQSSDSNTESGKDTVTFNSKKFSGLSSETVSRFIDNIRSIEQEFADEFKRLFFWGL